MPDIFSEDHSAEDLDLGFNDLVGEDKKYKEPDALAKAYAHLERHTRTVEAEAATLRAERDVQDALRNRNENNGGEPPQQPDPAPVAPKQNAPDPKDVDFRSQIQEQIRALKDEDRASENMDKAAARMVELYGSEDGASEAIRKRASELNVSVDWLRDSASKSPEAFYASMGLSTPKQDRTTPTPNSNVRLPDTGGKKDFEYFDRLRKENPKLYYTAGVTREMQAQAKALGDQFYART